VSPRSPRSTSRSTWWTSFGAPSTPRATAREAIAAGAKALWLQRGLVSPEARRIATEAGLDYVEDACTAVVHARLERRAESKPGIRPFPS